MTEHGECLVYLVQPDGLFTLLEVAHKSESQPGTHRELFLRESRRAALILYELPNRIFLIHQSNNIPVRI